MLRGCGVSVHFAVLGIVWVAVCGVASADPAVLVRTIPSPYATPDDAAEAIKIVNGSLYNYDQNGGPNPYWSLNKISLSNGSVTKAYSIGCFAGLAYDGTAFWSYAYPGWQAGRTDVNNDGDLVRFDLSGNVLRTLPRAQTQIDQYVSDVCWDGSQLWVASNASGGDRQYDRISRIDPVSGHSTASFLTQPLFGDSLVSGIDFDGQNLWAVAYVFDSRRTSIFKLSTDGAILSRFDVQTDQWWGASGLAVDGNTVWLSRNTATAGEDGFYQFAVPEPGTISLLLLGGLTILRPRRRTAA